MGVGRVHLRARWAVFAGLNGRSSACCFAADDGVGRPIDAYHGEDYFLCAASGRHSGAKHRARVGDAHACASSAIASASAPGCLPPLASW